MPKATRLETEQRLEIVRQMILAGNVSGQIIPTISDKWKITDRMARNYIVRARAGIQAFTNVNTEYLKAEHLSIRRDIRRRAREAKDLRAELAAAQDEAKLFGLYPSEKHEVTGADGGPLVIKAFDYADAIAPIAARPEFDRLAPGEDQGYFDGATLGQNDDSR